MVSLKLMAGAARSMVVASEESDGRRDSRAISGANRFRELGRERCMYNS